MKKRVMKSTFGGIEVTCIKLFKQWHTQSKQKKKIDDLDKLRNIRYAIILGIMYEQMKNFLQLSSFVLNALY